MRSQVSALPTRDPALAGAEAAEPREAVALPLEVAALPLEAEALLPPEAAEEQLPLEERAPRGERERRAEAGHTRPVPGVPRAAASRPA